MWELASPNRPIIHYVRGTHHDSEECQKSQGPGVGLGFRVSGLGEEYFPEGLPEFAVCIQMSLHRDEIMSINKAATANVARLSILVVRILKLLTSQTLKQKP